MKRTVYFIYDIIKNGYCTNTHDARGSFDKATIYLTNANALKSIKDRVETYQNTIDWGKPTDKKENNFRYALSSYNEAVRRSKIPNWGLEVVPVKLTVGR